MNAGPRQQTILTTDAADGHGWSAASMRFQAHVSVTNLITGTTPQQPRITSRAFSSAYRTRLRTFVSRRDNQRFASISRSIPAQARKIPAGRWDWHVRKTRGRVLPVASLALGKTMKMARVSILPFLLGLAACHTVREGSSAFEVLPPPRSSPAPASDTKAKISESDIRIDYVAARARRALASPVYPADALAARAGRFTAYITFAIDETGRVVDAQPSLARFTLPNAHAAAFLQAIYAALETWRFDPARQVYWQRVPNEDDRYLRADPVRQPMEVRFTFSESGTVASSPTR